MSEHRCCITAVYPFLRTLGLVKHTTVLVNAIFSRLPTCFQVLRLSLLLAPSISDDEDFTGYGCQAECCHTTRSMATIFLLKSRGLFYCYLIVTPLSGLDITTGNALRRPRTR